MILYRTTSQNPFQRTFQKRNDRDSQYSQYPCLTPSKSFQRGIIEVNDSLSDNFPKPLQKRNNRDSQYPCLTTSQNPFQTSFQKRNNRDSQYPCLTTSQNPFQRGIIEIWWFSIGQLPKTPSKEHFKRGTIEIHNIHNIPVWHPQNPSKEE